MAYTSRIKMNKQATGANANTWGSVLNTEVFSVADQAIAGYTSVSVDVSGAIVLSVTDGAVSRGRNKLIELKGTLASAKVFEVPAASREYTIINSTSGSFACTFKVTGGGDSGTAVAQGYVSKIYSNATSVNPATGDAAQRTVGIGAANVPDASLADIRYSQVAGDQSITGSKIHTSLVESNSSIKVSSGRAYAVPYKLTDAASVILSLDESNTFFVTLAGNRTMGFPLKGRAGQSGLIYVYQDGTGSRTLSYVSCWKFSGGTAPTATTSINSCDIISYNVRTVAASLTVTAIDAEMKTDFKTPA